MDLNIIENTGTIEDGTTGTIEDGTIGTIEDGTTGTTSTIEEIITTFNLTDYNSNVYTITPEFVWEIRRMDVVPVLNSLKNVVKNIHWTYSTTVIIDNVNYSAFYSDITVLKPPEIQFITYDELTKDIIISWLNSSINLNNLNSKIISRLQDKFAPNIVSMPLPFIAQ